MVCACGLAIFGLGFVFVAGCGIGSERKTPAEIKTQQIALVTEAVGGLTGAFQILNALVEVGDLGQFQIHRVQF